MNPSAGIFDRVVSVEMFDLMENRHEQLRRIATWLKPGGRRFVHHFTHRGTAHHHGAASQRVARPLLLHSRADAFP